MKYHLVCWDQICQALDCAGLCIRSMRNVSKEMLGKWLWRLGMKFQGLWRHIVVEKYEPG